MVSMTTPLPDKETLFSLVRSDPEQSVGLFLELLSLLATSETEIRSMKEENRVLRDKIRELEIRLDKNSQNSSKPPSSDGYRKPSPKSLRTPSGKKTGGQEGHGGDTLLAVPVPDRVVDVPLLSCSCGADLSGVISSGYEARQVFDLPEPRLSVTEYRLANACCPSCRKKVTATAPEGVTAPTQYGSRFKAALAYLHEDQALPVNRVRQLCSDLFGSVVSEGTILEASRLLSDRLAPFVERVRALLIQASVLHTDETGLRSEAALRWCHVASTSLLTLLGLHEKRGKEGIEALGVVNRAQGTIVHDFWGPYLSYPGLHSFCNAHLLRELTAIEEFDLHLWPTEMKTFLLDMNNRAKNRTTPPDETDRNAVFSALSEILSRGWTEAGRPGKSSSRGRPKATPAQNLLRRFEEYQRQIMAFYFDPEIPFTNNQAEQDLRMVKVRQKVSGGFRTDTGARIFLTLKSYTQTLRKQGKDVWTGLTQAMMGSPFLPSDA